jgi:hypothetical protein
MLAHLPIIILAGLPLARVADDVPKFDITAQCRTEGGTPAQQQHCADDEAQARQELQAEWVQFMTSDKMVCLRRTNAGSAGSYVELQTCLETARDSRPSR